MARKFVFQHPIKFKGIDGTVTFPEGSINNAAPTTASIGLLQDISVSGNPIFDDLIITTNINVADNKWIIQKNGSEVEFVPSGTFDITGSLTTNQNLTVPQDLNVLGKFTAKEIKTQFTSASIVFPSGSTKFGDDTDDKHSFTGSVSVGNETTMSITIPTVDGSGPITYNITEFRNVPFPSAPYNQTQPVTEYAGVNLVAPFSANQRYIRKSFAKIANTIVTGSVSSYALFNAVTASAPRSDDVSLFEQLPITSENDFMFFRNGMIMEPDALTVQQSGSIFEVNVNNSNMGYSLNIGDEIVAWGKFNS